MMAKFLLSFLLLSVVLYAWIAAARAPLLQLLFMLLAVPGFYFVWMPDHATAIAHMVGIGRGVDLFIYLWIIGSLLATLNLHLHLRAQMEVITAIGRHIAVREAFQGSDPETTPEEPSLQNTPLEQ